jgi:ankyrin repeat protein
VNTVSQFYSILNSIPFLLLFVVLGVLPCEGISGWMDNHGGRTPLYIDSQEGHVPAVQALLQGGADVDKARDNGATSLIMATLKGHVPVVQALLQGGAVIHTAADGIIYTAANGAVDAAADNGTGRGGANNGWTMCRWGSHRHHRRR